MNLKYPCLRDGYFSPDWIEAFFALEYRLETERGSGIIICCEKSRGVIGDADCPSGGVGFIADDVGCIANDVGCIANAVNYRNV